VVNARTALAALDDVEIFDVVTTAIEGRGEG